jgi:hypothetical protein
MISQLAYSDKHIQCVWSYFTYRRGALFHGDREYLPAEILGCIGDLDLDLDLDRTGSRKRRT